MSNVIDFKKLTPDQQTAVKAKGTVLVSAAAGSGKTTALLARIKYLLLSGVELRRMLVLVFNNATADELKEKLRNELFNCACSSSGATCEMYRRQLDELSFASISTIHAFCQSLLRKNFERIGLSPSFTVLDERAHQSYMNRALDSVIERYAASEDEIFAVLSVVFEKGRSEDSLRENVFKLFNSMDVQPDRKVFFDNISRCYADTSAYCGEIRRNTKRIIAKVEATLRDTVPFLAAAPLENAENGLHACKVLLSGGEDDIVAFAADYVRIKTRFSKKTDRSAYYASVACLDEIDEQLALYVSLYSDPERLKKEFEQNGQFVAKLMEIVLAFDEELKALKEEDNVLSFSDLEHKAVELIDSGAELASDFDQVFVDEYQDVNPTQEYIISHLTRNNVFMVGDIKQSIYGFRLADPQIFQDKLDAMELAAARGEGNEPIRFLDNFRSENQILEFVNGIFDVVMTKESADTDYKNTSRFNPATKTDEDGNVVLRDDGVVQMHIFNIPSVKKPRASGLYKLPEHADAEREDGNTESEARFIAAEIKRLKGKGVFNGRRLNFGDFAVLFRKRNAAANRIVEILKAEQIPVDDGAFTEADVKPERELVNFLRVLDNPRQDYYLAGYMLSYFGGYDEDELAAVAKVKKKDANFYDAVLIRAKEEDALGQKLQKTLRVIDDYRIKASFKNVAELMSSIISETGYDAYVTTQGESAATALEGFVSSVAKEENLVSISRFLEGYGELEDDERRSSGGDRIRVSTFHGFKGLEIPVVFVSNLGAEIAQPRPGDLSVCGKGFIGISYFDVDNKESKAATLSKKALEFMIHEKEYKEEMRLLYVALTRAQKFLYITGGLGEKTVVDEDKWQEKIETERFDYEKKNLEFVFAAIRNGSVKIPIVRHTEPESQLPVRQKPMLDLAGKDLANMIEKEQAYVYPHEEASSLALKYSVTALESTDDNTVRVYEDKTDVGILYHRVMENVDLGATTDEDVKNELERMLNEGVITEEERAEIKSAEIAAALSSEVLRLAAGSRTEKEKPFMLYVPAREVVPGSTVEDKVLVQGIIDLLILGEKNVIVDYKYSLLKSEDAKKKYKKQLYLYKKAVETSFCKKIDRLVILSLRNGTEIEVL